jgi:hypothetical protein
LVTFGRPQRTQPLSPSRKESNRKTARAAQPNESCRQHLKLLNLALEHVNPNSSELKPSLRSAERGLYILLRGCRRCKCLFQLCGFRLCLSDLLPQIAGHLKSNNRVLK